MKVLVTGGAGFVGSFLCEELHGRGFEVRILDCFEPQVHDGAVDNLGSLRAPGGALKAGVELIRGDVRNRQETEAALNGVDAVIHLAAQVGVGQSMYEIERYVSHNTSGTAVLLELLANGKHSVRKIVVASSMSIYGEGAYNCANCGEVYPVLRSSSRLKSGDWEMTCPKCGGAAGPKPTPEVKPLMPTSIYAITKRDQEEMCLTVGRAYGIPTVALRFFNIYGPRQSLNNPYTGVAAIFSSRLLNRRSPVVFEDGNQSRDFVHVTDIVQAIVLSLTKDEADFETFNVGTGRATSIRRVAELLANKLGIEIAPQIENKFREGDIRHCYADIRKIGQKLGYVPRVDFERGLSDLISWAREQEAEDRFEKATVELRSRGLAH